MKLYITITLLFLTFLIVSTCTYSDLSRLENHHQAMVESGTWPESTPTPGMERKQ